MFRRVYRLGIGLDRIIGLGKDQLAPALMRGLLGRRSGLAVPGHREGQVAAAYRSYGRFHYHKNALVGAIAITVAFFSSSQSFSQEKREASGKLCGSIFMNNEATIEKLAEAGNSAGIRSLFTKAGCADANVNIRKHEGVTANQTKSRIRCHYEPLATIICLLGQK
jgi:hypothetical protein